MESDRANTTQHSSRSELLKLWYTVVNIPAVVAARPTTMAVTGIVLWGLVIAAFCIVTPSVQGSLTAVCILFLSAGMVVSALGLLIWSFSHPEDWKTGSQILGAEDYVAGPPDNHPAPDSTPKVHEDHEENTVDGAEGED